MPEEEEPRVFELKAWVAFYFLLLLVKKKRKANHIDGPARFTSKEWTRSGRLRLPNGTVRGCKIPASSHRCPRSCLEWKRLNQDVGVLVREGSVCNKIKSDQVFRKADIFSLHAGLHGMAWHMVLEPDLVIWVDVHSGVAVLPSMVYLGRWKQKQGAGLSASSCNCSRWQGIEWIHGNGTKLISLWEWCSRSPPAKVADGLDRCRNLDPLRTTRRGHGRRGVAAVQRGVLAVENHGLIAKAASSSCSHCKCCHHPCYPCIGLSPIGKWRQEGAGVVPFHR